MKKIIMLLCIAMVGCGTVPSVRPIGKDKKAMTLSAGGPIAAVNDINILSPYTVIRYRQGLSDHTDLHVGIHPTMALLGNICVDIGGTRQIIRQVGWRPALSLETSIYGFYHFDELSSVRVYPEISLIANYGRPSRGEVLYFGVQNMVQLARPYVVFVPLVGAELPLRKKFAVNAETKWYTPSEESEDRVVDYTIKPFGHGALGFVFGVSYKF